MKQRSMWHAGLMIDIVPMSPDRDSLASTYDGEVRALHSVRTRPLTRSVQSLLTENSWIDWPAGVVIGSALKILLVSHLKLSSIDPSIRFSIYAALAGGLFAFVAIAFTPFAILVSLGTGESSRRLRLHDRHIRRHFLLGTLTIMFCAVVLIGCGALDATSNGSNFARLLGSVVFAIAGMKIIRLTYLFWAILTASTNDIIASGRHTEHLTSSGS